MSSIVVVDRVPPYSYTMRNCFFAPGHGSQNPKSPDLLTPCNADTPEKQTQKMNENA